MGLFKKEKIRSGQAYLYRKNGLNSTIIDVQMKDNVNGMHLKNALVSAMVRYPYFTKKIVEENGDFYLKTNLLPFVLEEPSEPHSLGSKEINYHLVDVTYKNNRISVAFHHGLCDGLGIKPFVETLVYYYCMNMSGKYYNASEVRKAGERLLKHETKEPLDIEKYEIGDGELPVISRDGFALSETANVTNEKKYYRYEMKVNQEEFMKFAKTNNATPSIAVALFASKAIKNVYPTADKPIICNLATSLRHELELDNTYKNFAGSIVLPFTKDIENLTFKEQSTEFRKLLNSQKQLDKVKSDANNMLGLSDKLDTLETFNDKQQLLSFFDNLSLNTFIISYLGQFNVGECEQYIDSMHMYSSGTTGLIINMLCVNGCISIDFLQSFESDRYVKEFENVLNEHGLKFVTSDVISVNTPRDSVNALC